MIELHILPYFKDKSISSITALDIKRWQKENYMKVRFKISEEVFFNNGRVILKSLPQIEHKFRMALSQEATISITRRQSKNKPAYDGINAISLNKALRKCLDTDPIKGETHVENGVFFHKTKEGFDFSVYDEKYNMSRLYNYYLGSVGVLKGDEKIYELYKKMGYKKKVWEGKIKEIRSKVTDNTDYVVDKEILTVAGELQFGNWALIYRDLFRLLDADSNPGIDFYIYIAADKELSKLLSANTVSFKQANDVISEYRSIIKTPIWLIGLGIEEL